MSVKIGLAIPAAPDADPASRPAHRFAGDDPPGEPRETAGAKIDRSDDQFAGGQKILERVSSVASMISDRRENTADFLKLMASEFDSLRKAISQVCRLDRFPDSNLFTLPQTQGSIRAGVHHEGRGASLEKLSAWPNDRTEVPRQRLNERHPWRPQKEISELITPEGMKAPDGEIVPKIDGLMGQVDLSGEAKRLLGRASRTNPAERGISIIEFLTAIGRSAEIGDRESESVLNQSLAPTHSIDGASPVPPNGMTNGDQADAMLAQFATTIREASGSHGHSNPYTILSISEAPGEFAPMMAAGPLGRAIGFDRRSQFGDPTRALGRAAGWGDLGAALERLRQETNAEQRRASPLGRPPLSSAEPGVPTPVRTTKAWEPGGQERRPAPVWPTSRLLPSRSSSPGAATHLFDYEIRRILEPATRIMEEATVPRPTPLLASMIPDPRTRM